MSKHHFDVEGLEAALDQIGHVAVQNGARLELNIYGGAALMLAGNFRYSTEDADIAPLGANWPEWLTKAVSDIAKKNNWADDWLNDAVAFHLSSHAGPQDHILFGTFPRQGDVGLTVNVPTAEYMLALKLKAMRINDPAKGATETNDILALMETCGVKSVDGAIEVLARFFPVSAQNTDKQRFLLKHLMSAKPQTVDPRHAPKYPSRRISKDEGWER